MEGDYIGFTQEGTQGALSFSYSAEGRTLFVGQDAEAMPRVGDEFRFMSQLQVNFSVAVQLTTGTTLTYDLDPVSYTHLTLPTNREV